MLFRSRIGERERENGTEMTKNRHDITDLVDELNDAMASVFDGRQCPRMTAVDTGSGQRRKPELYARCP